MSKVLFLNQPTLSHVNVLRNIALQMKKDGHTVHFLMPGVRAAKTHIPILDATLAAPNSLRGHRLNFDLIRPPLSVVAGMLLVSYKSGYKEIVHAMNLFSKGIEYYTRRIVTFIREHRPDVLVTDFAFPASSFAADITGTPYVTVYHSGLPFHGDDIPPFGSGLPIGTDDQETLRLYARAEERTLQGLDHHLNQAREKFGLTPMAPDMLRRPYSPWLNLVASATAAEAPRSNLTANTLFIGPCFARHGETAADFPFDQLRADRCKVYVSLGTVYNNRPAVFKKIMHALDDPLYQTIISAGGAYQALQRETIPRNAMIFKHVPQVALLPRIDLFISHGGNNSTNEALASGKPLIVLPVGGEQADNASRVVYLGVGQRLDIAQFTEAQLRAAVETIRTNVAFRERAEMIGKALAQTHGALTAAHCIAWVARERKPLERTADTPVTVTPDDLENLLRQGGKIIPCK